MKYYRFEKIQKGKNPIIRVTYKNWWGGFVIRDICKSDSVEGFWVFMDNGQLTHRFEPINNFFENDDDIYWVNGAQRRGLCVATVGIQLLPNWNYKLLK